MKLVLATVALAAVAAAALLSGCEQAPLEPELVAGDATAPKACTFQPETTPTLVVPSPVWGGAPAYTYELCFHDTTKTLAICTYREGEYDLKILDCSPAPGVTCVWNCP